MNNPHPGEPAANEALQVSRNPKGLDCPLPGIHVNLDQIVLHIASQQPLTVLSSSPFGGGLSQARHILNVHVDKDYNHPDPASDLQDFAHRRGIDEPFIGLLTAAYVHKARLAAASQGELAVCTLLTAGLGNTISAGISPPAAPQPGTINTILLIDACLEPAALVNAVITATEAKCDMLRRFDKRSAEGEIATGTSTDAIVVACTGRGDPLHYAGPATPVGWLIARTVRQALQEALE